MFHRIFTLAFAVTVVFNSLRAADSNPIKQQYWQTLSNVYMVWTDHAGNPWFRTVGGDVAESYSTNFKQIGMEQTFLLGDRRDRIWVGDPKHAGPAKYFDGKQWHATKILAEKAFEDSAGRVFLADGSRIHVLDKGTWTSQEIVAKPNGGETQFAEDSKGRVWAWVTDGTMGVWVHDAGKWTNHHSSNGFPTDNVTLLVPIAGDRLLIWPKEPLRKRHYAVWAPGPSTRRRGGKTLRRPRPDGASLRRHRPRRDTLLRRGRVAPRRWRATRPLTRTQIDSKGRRQTRRRSKRWPRKLAGRTV